LTSNKIIYIPCSTPQMNTWSSDWIQFYREHRLGYQLKLTLDQYGDGTIYEKGYLAFEILFLPIILLWFYIIACYILVDTSINDNLVNQFNSKQMYDKYMTWLTSFSGSVINMLETFSCLKWQTDSPMELIHVFVFGFTVAFISESQPWDSCGIISLLRDETKHWVVGNLNI
jgi:hypothetical protein